MARGKKKFALIWWVASGQTDVIPVTSIPKKYRHVDALVTLTWNDFQTKARSKEEAKVVAISDDETELHRQIVTKHGTLHNLADKIFSESVIEKKKHMTLNKNLVKNIQRSCKKKVEDRIKTDTPIFFPENVDLHKSVPKTCTVVSSTTVVSSALHHHTPSPSPSCTKDSSGFSRINTAIIPVTSHSVLPCNHSSSPCLSQDNRGISPQTIDYPAPRPIVSSYSTYPNQLVEWPQKEITPASYPPTLSASSQMQPSTFSQTSSYSPAPSPIFSSYTSQTLDKPRQENVTPLGTPHGTPASYPTPPPGLSQMQPSNFSQTSSYSPAPSPIYSSYTSQTLDKPRQENVTPLGTPHGTPASYPTPPPGLSQMQPSNFSQTSSYSPAPSPIYSSYTSQTLDKPRQENVTPLGTPHGTPASYPTPPPGLSQMQPSTFSQTSFYPPAPSPIFSSYTSQTLDKPRQENVTPLGTPHGTPASSHPFPLPGSSRHNPDNQGGESQACNVENSHDESNAHGITDSSNKAGSLSSDCESYDGGSGLGSRIVLGEVTNRDIQFQTELLQAMKKARESQIKMNVNSEKTFSVPSHYFEKRDNMVELAPNCGFYLPRSKVTYLEMKSGIDDDWKILVRETLLEVYGSSIANYSATGKRGSRPGIDVQLFRGLYEWVNRRVLKPIDKKTFIDFINKLASNKRKYRESSKLQSQKKKPRIQPLNTGRKPENQSYETTPRSSRSYKNHQSPVGGQGSTQRGGASQNIRYDFAASLNEFGMDRSEEDEHIIVDL